MKRIKYFNEVNITSKHFVTPLLGIIFFVFVFLSTTFVLSLFERNNLNKAVQAFNSGIATRMSSVNYYNAYGFNFVDQNLKDNISLYLKSDTNILNSNKTGETVSIVGKDYFVKKIPFNDLDNLNSGSLIFVPVLTLLQKIVLVLLVQTILITIYVLIKHNKKD